jgi:two-component system, NtrC family, response regulator AtoC
MATSPIQTAIFSEAVGSLPPPEVIFGHSSVMAEVQDKLRRVSSANIPVLIHGENGTGKEIISRMIHVGSPWSKGPFVKLSCPAIPGTLLESELFGYEKGAFTGAYGSKPGRVEMADRGTLFLDEIAELEFGLQAKLLQLLQDGQFCRIGAQEDRKVEVRIVCATNRQLQDEVAAGTFREDLYYRINVVNIELPALRDRSGDIPLLVEYFLRSYSDKFECKVAPLSASLQEMLRRYSWPGNIRQLENLVKRYVILGSEEAILEELRAGNESLDMDIPAGQPISLKTLTRNATRGLERKIILKTLQQHQWNRKSAARALDISYRALLYKLKEAGLPSQRRAAAEAQANRKNGTRGEA